MMFSARVIRVVPNTTDWTIKLEDDIIEQFKTMVEWPVKTWQILPICAHGGGTIGFLIVTDDTEGEQNVSNTVPE